MKFCQQSQKPNTALLIPVFQGKRKKQNKSDPGEYFASASSSKSKNKLNYAFLKPQIVPAKEECKPSSSIR